MVSSTLSPSYVGAIVCDYSVQIYEYFAYDQNITS